MQKRKLLKRGKFNFLFITLSLIYLTFSCSTGPETKEAADMTEKSSPKIESIRIAPGTSDNDIVIEIINSKPATYTSLTLSQPLRFIVDIDAITPEKFTEPAGLDSKIIKTLHLEKIKDRPLSTRLVALLSQNVEYNITEQGRVIKIFLSP
ncbi:MAG: AMIN domain-containing protein, partial [Thermodesulfobacteriota bacterium]|nr:AMIN domain-containing protein [Thermodesulfobacteriota bacterium]